MDAFTMANIKDFDKEVSELLGEWAILFFNLFCRERKAGTTSQPIRHYISLFPPQMEGLDFGDMKSESRKSSARASENSSNSSKGSSPKIASKEAPTRKAYGSPVPRISS